MSAVSASWVSWDLIGFSAPSFRHLFAQYTWGSFVSTNPSFNARGSLVSYGLCGWYNVYSV